MTFALAVPTTLWEIFIRACGVPEVTPGSMVTVVKPALVTGAFDGTKVVAYAGAFVTSQSRKAVRSGAVRVPLPSPIPGVASICRRRSRKFAGPRPVSVLSGFKVRLRHTVRLFQSGGSYEAVVWYTSRGAGLSTTS